MFKERNISLRMKGKTSPNTKLVCDVFMGKIYSR